MRLIRWLRWLCSAPPPIVSDPDVRAGLNQAESARRRNERAFHAREEANENLQLSVSATRRVTQRVVEQQRSRHGR